jgi:PleD family two-component response regulator
MVLCAVEDLMFSSKIRGAARQRGVDVRFVRSPEAMVADATAHAPALVLLDLNADRLRPLEMVQRLRECPELAGIRVLGFVSHVQEDRIAAARDAGVDQVMARSAFFAQLPSLLQASA